MGVQLNVGELDVTGHDRGEGSATRKHQATTGTYRVTACKRRPAASSKKLFAGFAVCTSRAPFNSLNTPLPRIQLALGGFVSTNNAGYIIHHLGVSSNQDSLLEIIQKKTTKKKRESDTEMCIASQLAHSIESLETFSSNLQLPSCKVHSLCLVDLQWVPVEQPRQLIKTENL